MRVRFSRLAEKHLLAIRSFIAEYRPLAAELVRYRIVETIEALREFPRLGHAGAKQGTRELVVPGLPYIIVYRLDIGDKDEVVILGIFHAAQQRRAS